MRADEVRDRLFIGEDAHNIGMTLDLAIEAFDLVDRVDLRPMILWEAHEGENVRRATLPLSA
jgi:hypothetical protein